MSDRSYSVAPSKLSGRDMLWAEIDGHHPFPIAEFGAADPEVFRAAAAVLAPDDAIVHLLAQRYMDDRFGEDQWQHGGERWDFCLRDVKLLLVALRDHATDGGQS